MSSSLIASSALYIHIPWCIKKCPYCDFNSHKAPEKLPESHYVAMLLEDLKKDLAEFNVKQISSIFIGGGTPSLLSAESYQYLFSSLKQLVSFSSNIEITLEANPGTVEQQRFYDYRQIGINRLSLGIQSFNPAHLKALGRIHDEKQAHRAIEVARQAGFDNINIDLMHGLPSQTVDQGLADLSEALQHEPEHLSWYQLTIEPNTIFYKSPPPLPNEKESFELEQKGFEKLSNANFLHYEVSAFCKPEKPSHHNLNYWLFGDYYGIGAGAHGKITLSDRIYRTQKYRQPHDYLNPEKSFLIEQKLLNSDDLLFEFMLNVTRLNQSIPFHLFESQTGLSCETLKPFLHQAVDKKLIDLSDEYWLITDHGKRYRNELILLCLK